LGGYSKVDHYQLQNPQQFITTLKGIPQPFAERLTQQGFRVIRDSKGNTDFSNTTLAAKNTIRHGSAACEEGQSSEFPCQNLSLLSHLSLDDLGSTRGANDIWGHVDLNDNNEYALIGLRNGLAVVNVTDPENPQVVGNISGADSTWRDIKVYQFYNSTLTRWQAYAYVTTEAVEGLSIVDLNGLPDSISLVRRQETDLSAHNIYISNVDYGLNIATHAAEPLVHIVGSNNSGGAYRSYSLADPQILGVTLQQNQATPLDYTHDASSLMITDARATNDCSNSDEEGCRVMLDFNEGELRIWDHTHINSNQELASVSYPNTGYVHSGWWSEDKNYVIVHDELDERNFGLNTTLNIFDISDLTSPQLVHLDRPNTCH
jgi:choice-of-anchor B domain-containing protein